jgi:FlaA1/EpsC-like NDP-sugar epimerase
MILDGKKILITGGTGSLGKVLVKRLLSCELGKPEKIIVFSRDEAKQHFMRLDYLKKQQATDDIIYRNFQELLTFRIGDIRDYHSVSAALREADVVFQAAALKQVPTCEYFPFEAVQTNIFGAENIVRAIKEYNLPIQTVVGVSTDKACKPVNVMGMTKAIQERIFINANINCPDTKFVCVRYGNVLASRGSVIPLFHDQIKNGGPVTITSLEMTRFLLSLDQGVDTIFAVLKGGNPGETYIPRIKAARVLDVADVLIGNRSITKVFTSVRPGEKMHEILVSEEEVSRTVDRGKYFAIKPILPEILSDSDTKQALTKEFSSEDNLMSKEELKKMLEKHHLMVEDNFVYE